MIIKQEILTQRIEVIRSVDKLQSCVSGVVSLLVLGPSGHPASDQLSVSKSPRWKSRSNKQRRALRCEHHQSGFLIFQFRIRRSHVNAAQYIFVVFLSRPFTHPNQSREVAVQPEPAWFCWGFPLHWLLGLLGFPYYNKVLNFTV